MLRFFKRNGNPVEEVAKKIEALTTRMDKLEKKKIELVEKKKALILDGKDATFTYDQIRRIDQEISDISDVLLPDLEEKLNEARDEEKEKQRQEKIREILADSATLYNEIPERMAAVKRHRAGYRESLVRLQKIHQLHEDNLIKLAEVKGQRNPNEDWNILENFLRRIG